MNFQLRITQLEAEMVQCTQQVNEWNAKRLRIEGALLILRQLTEEANESITTNPAPAADSTGAEA